MKINQAQIDKLYLFTRQHFVEYYDLQTELVDHLANAIEAQWDTNPKRNFDEALQIEFKKFGIFGFSDVVQERHVALEKKYRKIVWSHFKNFFRLPQIIGTFSAVGILFLLLKISFHREIIFISILTLLLVLFFVELVRNTRKMKRKNEETGKKWLFKEILNGYGQGSGFMFLPLQTFIHLRSLFNDDLILLGGSFLIIALALVQYIVLVIIPKKAEQYLIETYPEYEFSK
ncbi:hypothetical protein FLAN108750_11695 [Flavobacterium antarcticum]|uniref:hypothetical protein n=1 Tax=Flavobacterium antarcticum TaxID=271155 RepID=UPI0003B64745|nr:hypothetical protein [Flavobacterium antarcticum]